MRSAKATPYVLPTLRVIMVLGCLAGLLACSSDAGGTSGGPPDSAVAATHSCAFQTRQVQYCGGTTPLGDWTAYCQDGPCPTTLADHYLEYPDPSGSSATGTCSTVSQYRDVFDFSGSCHDWMLAGDPLSGPMPIYCGHSLIYNEFASGIGSQDCATCAAAQCSSEYVACCPSQQYATCSTQSTFPNDCDDFIRCLRDCTAGDDMAASACLQLHPGAVNAANAFATCVAQSCRDLCD